MAVGVRETGDGRRKGWEAGDKFKKVRVFYLLLLIIQSNTNPATFFYLHLTLSEASNKILYARKRKFVLGLKYRISFREIENLFKSFTSLVMNEMKLNV